MQEIIQLDTGICTIAYLPEGVIGEGPAGHMISKSYTVEDKMPQSLTWENLKFNKFRTGNAQGMLHKEDGPAYIEFFADGSIRIESWYEEGHRHNITGPASMYYNCKGEVYSRIYALNGTILSKGEYRLHCLKLGYTRGLRSTYDKNF
jgi:hypothetical protein